ncbi:homogentisate geranylgeranyltransferase [Citrus sinensis]|uniref:Homogentisate geranylgeranyltransferase n=1 Tax=Citrus sinensis TaxID=2711 RepID=A0ACB8N224_CITSI|nr:homogentisate geranylgeranyltransferase [Citrus sinensis]
MALKLDIKKLYDRLEWDFLAKADVFGKLKEAFQLEINKPDLPLTSGDVSMRTGIAIASSSLLVSLAMGIMLRSPPLLLALIIWFLLASAYSVDVIAITSVSLLPLQNLDDLTPTYFMGFLKAMVPGLLMTVYEFAINQLYDVKIDKINKPDLPLTSGDVSMRTGIAIASSSLLVSLAMGIMLRSPPLLLALIIWFLLASAYSVDKYVLGRQIAITRTLMFAVAIKCCFCFVISLLKDIPDEDGDREFGIQTPSVILGKESVLWLCVYVLLISYGAVIIVGLTSSPYLLSKLVMIISHIMLATLLWHQARTVDLSSKASTLSFYMFIWKLHIVQYLVLPFVRL